MIADMPTTRADQDAIERLTEIMRRRRLSQEDVARQIGATQGAVSRWLTRERRPSLSMVLAIERVFRIPARTWALDTSSAA